jgi:hypothetical protein
MLLSWWCPLGQGKGHLPAREYIILIPILTPLSCHWTMDSTLKSHLDWWIFRIYFPNCEKQKYCLKHLHLKVKVLFRGTVMYEYVHCPIWNFISDTDQWPWRLSLAVYVLYKCSVEAKRKMADGTKLVKVWVSVPSHSSTGTSDTYHWKDSYVKLDLVQNWIPKGLLNSRAGNKKLTFSFFTGRCWVTGLSVMEHLTSSWTPYQRKSL